MPRMAWVRALDFTSDNGSGIAPEILQAIIQANQGYAASYGGDEITQGLKRRFSDIFEREVEVFPVVTGTAANALALGGLTPPFGAVFCYDEAHVHVDECGAPEMFTGGAKLIGVGGDQGKIAPDRFYDALGALHTGDPHYVQPAAVTITQLTEAGTLYRGQEIDRLVEIARLRKLWVHMDGARFANAVAALGCTPAEASWKAGIDVLSFGATKNGALAAEAVVFFNPDLARDFPYRRKRAGHLISKMRFVSAQLEAYLADDLWLGLAARANRMAARLARGLASIPDVRLIFPVEGNELFVSLPKGRIEGLRKAGAKFHDWPGPAGGAGRQVIRLVASFCTEEGDVDRFLAILGS